MRARADLIILIEIEPNFIDFLVLMIKEEALIL